MAGTCLRRCILKTAKITIAILMLITTLTFLSGYQVGVTKGRPMKRIPFPQHQENYKNTLTWILNIKPNKTSQVDDAIIDKLAVDTNLKYVRKFRDLDDHFVFAYVMENVTHTNSSENDLSSVIDKVENQLQANPMVNWFSHQKIVSRQKRWMNFTDPFYRLQWHLTNTLYYGMDTNVTGVWLHNITGTGVTVSIVDDGVEWNNPDLEDNYNAAGSWDFNGDDNDPMPDGSKESNHHGTRCAGEVAAVPNSVCAVGVAYGAKVSGLRILDGPMTDSLEAEAFTKFFHINDIYSCSWGPDDDGKTVDGPHFLAAAAMKHGIDFGRHGYGSIYVVASGNGGVAADNCNYDGYANSIYTVTIGAVDETGHMPFYGEECASMLAVTFSNGGSLTRDIVTTDWTADLERSRTGCTEHHTGTSAAAPIAAGLIALVLDVQPCLTWRDVQYIIVLTALKVDVDVAHWQRNGAGLWHSHKHGFGLMNAWRLVNAARVWSQVPWLTSVSYTNNDVNLPITKGRTNPLKESHTVTEEETNGFDLYILETVQVTLTLEHPCRGYLEIRLESPHGTVSVLGAARPNDMSRAGFDHWTFSTVQCWGETPAGTWTLIITDNDYDGRYSMGVLQSWELKLYGTPMSQKQLKQRRKTIERSLDGSLLNSSAVCFPPRVTAPADSNMSVKTLKILSLMGVFLLGISIYETLESLFCFNKEKEEYSRRQKLIRRAHLLVNQALRAARREERAGLLTEDIPMQTFHDSRDSDLHNHAQSGLQPERSTSGQGHIHDNQNMSSSKLKSALNKLRDVVQFKKNTKDDIEGRVTKLEGSVSDTSVSYTESVNGAIGDNASQSETQVMIQATSKPGDKEYETYDTLRKELTNDKQFVNKGGYTLLPNDSDGE